MRLVNEDIDDILKPADSDDIREKLKKLSFTKKIDLIGELWYDDWEEFCLSIMRFSRVMGNFQFEEMLDDLIIMKQNEQNEQI